MLFLIYIDYIEFNEIFIMIKSEVREKGETYLLEIPYQLLERVKIERLALIHASVSFLGHSEFFN